MQPREPGQRLPMSWMRPVAFADARGIPARHPDP